jgi:hypothetical protein
MTSTTGNNRGAKMSATQIPTFEELREMFRITGEQFRVTGEQFRETREQMRVTGEQIAELRLAQKESQEKFDQRLKESELVRERSHEYLDKVIGRLGNRIGDLVESLIAKGIVRVFRELGYSFTRFGPSVTFIDENLGVSGEIDLFLENGDVACLVEVKTKLSVDDVKTHIDRMEKYRIYADDRRDKRRFIGAVGGVVVDDSVSQFALNRGFYVVQLSGDNVKVIPPEGKPKEW